MTTPNPKTEIGVGVMARAPEPGRVKTRLARSVGELNALRIYEELLLRVEREIAESAVSDTTPSVRAHLFVEPAEKVGEMAQRYPRFLDVQPQCPGDLGKRMRSALESLLDRYEKAALIGVDVPDLNLSHINAASSALEGAAVVFSPSPDGGYSLIGVKKLIPQLFDNIPWSAPDTLRKTLEVCRERGISYAFIEQLTDLDTVEDFTQIKWRPDSPELLRVINSAL